MLVGSVAMSVPRRMRMGVPDHDVDLGRMEAGAMDARRLTVLCRNRPAIF